LPVARKRAILAALIERIEVKVDQVDIHLRPLRLCALLDLPATPSQGVNDDEIELLSVPVRLRRSGREIRMVINDRPRSMVSHPQLRPRQVPPKGANSTRHDAYRRPDPARKSRTDTSLGRNHSAPTAGFRMTVPNSAARSMCRSRSRSRAARCGCTSTARRKCAPAST
jgi:hypothetical protein